MVIIVLHLQTYVVHGVIGRATDINITQLSYKPFQP